MNKLTDKEWSIQLKRVIDMVNEPHEEYEIQLILAVLYFTISEGYIWEFPKMAWRNYKIEKAIKLHKKCCELN